jgi:hypothetical protein
MLSFTRCFAMLSLLALVVLPASMVDARSPAGTPEFAAESVALQKMKTYFPAYSPLDAQMRSNRLSISIPAVNAKGKRVDFKCGTRKQTRRDGSYYYEVSTPVFAYQ